MHNTRTELSVVIPARNEAGLIGRTIGALASRVSGTCPELIVADGGSSDSTCDIARSMGANVVSTEPGRAIQMNQGAASACGKHLLFLHADTVVPSGYDRLIQQTLADQKVACGAFRLRIDAPGAVYRVIQHGVNFRSRWRSLPYGDQGLFMRSSDFSRLGGYKNLPVMEDYELVHRLRQCGQVRLVAASVRTSARRWNRQGVLCATLTNQMCIIGYHLGVSPRRLAVWRDDRCARRTAKNGPTHHADSHHRSGRADRAGAANAP